MREVDDRAGEIHERRHEENRKPLPAGRRHELGRYRPAQYTRNRRLQRNKKKNQPNGGTLRVRITYDRVRYGERRPGVVRRDVHVVAQVPGRVARTQPHRYRNQAAKIRSVTTVTKKFRIVRTLRRTGDYRRRRRTPGTIPAR